jgi:hypothetical protein
MVTARAGSLTFQAGNFVGPRRIQNVVAQYGLQCGEHQE